MPHTAQELLVLATKYEDSATEAFLVVAEDHCNCENSHCPHGEKPCHNKAGKRKAMYVGALCDECAKRMPEEYMKKDAAEKQKLDPKAKVRNRGTVCVPASSAKDKKDHFPINNIGQARNALARVHQYSSAPSWYKGSLKSLQELVSRKVHSKYPSIGKSDKKKSSGIEVSEASLVKYAENAQAFYNLIKLYEDGATPTRHFAEALKMAAENYMRESGDANDPETKRVGDLFMKEAKLVFDLIPEMEFLDNEIYQTQNNPTGMEEEPLDETVKQTSLEALLTKYSQGTPPPQTPVVKFEDLPVDVDSLPQAPKYEPISPEVQKALNQALGLHLQLDGKVGPETKAALNAFKAKYQKVYSLIG